MFESRLHRHNTWIENFSKEIELEDYSIVLESKHRELYLQIHQYKFTFVKHIQLFIFKLEILCLQIWHARWDLSTAHLVLLWKKKTPSPCYQLQWPLARTFKLQQELLQLPTWGSGLAHLAQHPLASRESQDGHHAVGCWQAHPQLLQENETVPLHLGL